MSFDDDIASAGKGKDAYFKVKDGANVIRILSEPVIIVSRFKQGVCFEGAPYCMASEMDDDEKLQKKFKTWIIDRTDATLKIYDMPYKVASEIKTLKDNPEYGFTTFPMEYDITINAQNAGTKEVKYSVLPARKEKPLTDEERVAFAEKTTVADIVTRMKERAKKEYEDSNAIQLDEPKGSYPTEMINPDDIPF